MRLVTRSLIAISAGLVALGVNLSRTHAAESYVIIDSQTGFILRAQEANQKRQIGSLTKIVTAAVVLDWVEHRGGNLNQVVSIPSQAFAGISENPIGFQPGDQITLRDLLYAALIQSDNIAAYTLAYYVGEQVSAILPAEGESKASPADTFVGQMNALAKDLKMEHSRFVNPHGIDANVRPMPYSTATDMARMARYVMNKASFRFYVSQKERKISFHRAGRQLNYLLRNTNELLGRDGIDGVKTGQTARAGGCLILSSSRQNEVVQDGRLTTVYPRHVILVLLGSANRFEEGAQLLSYGWQLYDQWAATGRRVDDPDKLL
jgi:serine-type D-Ala-D-Ala carboxypeptidase (penicillin-binding protein 5/6)